MITDELSRDIQYSAGLSGCKMITGTSAVTGPFQSFIVNEALAITELLDRNGNSVVSKMVLGTVTLSVGMLISAPKDDWFSSVTLSSGSAVGYLV